MTRPLTSTSRKGKTPKTMAVNLSAWLRAYAIRRGGCETRSERTGEHTEGQSIGERASEKMKKMRPHKKGFEPVVGVGYSLASSPTFRDRAQVGGKAA